VEARITINENADGELEIWLNPAGRDILSDALKALDEMNDHIHLAPEGTYNDIELRTIPYRPNDKLFDQCKIMHRPDAWDIEHFPHVMR
jgi:hypothetical protein